MAVLIPDETLNDRQQHVSHHQFGLYWPNKLGVEDAE